MTKNNQRIKANLIKNRLPITIRLRPRSRKPESLIQILETNYILER